MMQMLLEFLRKNIDEQSYTFLLSGFLDPLHIHGLGIAFLKKIIDLLPLGVTINDEMLKNALVYPEIILDEHNRIDIGILFQNERVFIVIENKILSGVSKPLQFDDYKRIASEVYSLDENEYKIFVVLLLPNEQYLTKHGVDQEAYTSVIFYKDIIGSIDSILKERKGISESTIECLKVFKREIERNIITPSLQNKTAVYKNFIQEAEKFLQNRGYKEKDFDLKISNKKGGQFLAIYPRSWVQKCKIDQLLDKKNRPMTYYTIRLMGDKLEVLWYINNDNQILKKIQDFLLGFGKVLFPDNQFIPKKKTNRKKIDPLIYRRGIKSHVYTFGDEIVSNKTFISQAVNCLENLINKSKGIGDLLLDNLDKFKTEDTLGIIEIKARIIDQLPKKYEKKE